MKRARGEKKREEKGREGKGERTKNKLHAMFHNFRRHGIENVSLTDPGPPFEPISKKAE